MRRSSDSVFISFLAPILVVIALALSGLYAWKLIRAKGGARQVHGRALKSLWENFSLRADEESESP